MDLLDKPTTKGTTLAKRTIRLWGFGDAKGGGRR
jgi:hypothetical protein